MARFPFQHTTLGGKHRNEASGRSGGMPFSVATMFGDLPNRPIVNSNNVRNRKDSCLITPQEYRFADCNESAHRFDSGCCQLGFQCTIAWHWSNGANDRLRLPELWCNFTDRSTGMSRDRSVSGSAIYPRISGHPFPRSQEYHSTNLTKEDCAMVHHCRRSHWRKQFGNQLPTLNYTSRAKVDREESGCNHGPDNLNPTKPYESHAAKVEEEHRSSVLDRRESRASSFAVSQLSPQDAKVDKKLRSTTIVNTNYVADINKNSTTIAALESQKPRRRCMQRRVMQGFHFTNSVYCRIMHSTSVGNRSC